jgi:4-amino-4-deoxychorismate lyase
MFPKEPDRNKSFRALINGIAADSVNIQDRGLHYGDGLFETIAIRNGQPLLWDQHMQRLCHGCERLRLPVPDVNLLRQEAESLCTGVTRAVLKILLTRGSGGRGYKAPVQPKPTRVVMRYSWPVYPEMNQTEGVAIRLCSTRLGHNTQLAGIKHLNRLEQVLARNEWDDPAIAEGLMLDHDGGVIEGTMSNVFIVENETLITPELSQCGVQGILRDHVLEIAEKLTIKCSVNTVSLAQVKSAQELFLTNSIIGVWPVRKFAEVNYTVGRITKNIIDKLES